MRQLLCFIAFLLLGIAGCTPEKQQTLPTVESNEKIGATPPTAITQADLDSITPTTKPYTLVLIVKTKNNPFFIPMIKAFEETAKELGVKGEVQAVAQETSVDQQIALVENTIGSGVQAILITPADSKALVPVLVKAQKAGIVVINLDNRLDAEVVKSNGLELGGYVGANNEEGGKLAGEALKTALNGTGSVAILEGIRGVDNAEARKRGFKAGADGLEVVQEESGEWETEKAYSKMQSILTRQPELKGVFCANDKMAIGAIKAISKAGKKGKIKVVGYDNIAGVKSALASGEMCATIEQHPELMGKYGARLAVGILEGKMMKGAEYLVPLEVIKGK